MSSRRSKGKSGIPLGFAIVLFLTGFLLGVYLGPKITDVVPQEILSRFAIRKIESTSKEKTEKKKLTKETDGTEGANKNMYSLEVAVFSDMESVTGLVDTLNTRGYFPDIQTAKDADRILYKVRIGLWTSKEDAMNFAKSFKTKEEMKVTVVEVK